MYITQLNSQEMAAVFSAIEKDSTTHTIIDWAITITDVQWKGLNFPIIGYAARNCGLTVIGTVQTYSHDITKSMAFQEIYNDHLPFLFDLLKIRIEKMK